MIFRGGHRSGALTRLPRVTGSIPWLMIHHHMNRPSGSCCLAKPNTLLNSNSFCELAVPWLRSTQRLRVNFGLWWNNFCYTKRNMLVAECNHSLHFAPSVGLWETLGCYELKHVPFAKATLCLIGDFMICTSNKVRCCVSMQHIIKRYQWLSTNSSSFNQITKAF